MNTVIFTDSCCDLPLNFIKDNNIELISLRVKYESEEFPDDLGQSIKYKDFYEKIKSGVIATTSQANAFYFEEEFRKQVKLNKSIIYIGFSSALSGCVNSARIAKEIIEEELPQADITIIDSKSASLGLGLLVYKAAEMIKEEKSKEEIVKWIEENKLKVNHWFTVDDLNHLKRGGRISSTVAIVGTMLNIKPIMHVNKEGKLIPVTKVKGRKKSIKDLFERLKCNIVNPKEQTIFISHGDCLQEAEILKNLILSEYEVKNCIINYIGPVIGSHSGPGTIALFFIGNSRELN